jgi:DNA-binding response OmpR family regulator
MEPVQLLVVEDEVLIHLSIEDALAEAGYEIVIAMNGKTAIAELDADAALFKGVITDIRLGSKETGWDVARHARELAPEMPIIYMTGDSAHEWASQGVPNSIVIQKPFAMGQLVAGISNLLNAQPPVL